MTESSSKIGTAFSHKRIQAHRPVVGSSTTSRWSIVAY